MACKPANWKHHIQIKAGKATVNKIICMLRKLMSFIDCYNSSINLVTWISVPVYNGSSGQSDPRNLVVANFYAARINLFPLFLHALKITRQTHSSNTHFYTQILGLWCPRANRCNVRSGLGGRMCGAWNRAPYVFRSGSQLSPSLYRSCKSFYSSIKAISTSICDVTWLIIYKQQEAV